MSESSPWTSQARSDGYQALPIHEDSLDDPTSYASSSNTRFNSPPTTKVLPDGGTFTLLSLSTCTPPNSDANNNTQGEYYTYTYAYGPTGLAGLRQNPYTVGSAIFASIGGLSFGYDQGVIANVLVMRDFVERWPVGDWEIGLMTAMLELGALLGALLAGTFTDRYSRRHSIFAACVVFIIGSAIQTLASSLEDLILGRAIGGIGIGALSMLSPLYMAEISPPELRGSLMSLEQFAIVLGVVLGFWTGFWTRDIPGALSWRIPLGIQILPGILLAVGCFFLPESPRLMVMQGRDDDAMQSLVKLRLKEGEEEGKEHPLVKIEFLEMKVEARLVGLSVGEGLASSSSLDLGEDDLNKDDVDDAAHKSILHAEIAAWSKLFSPRYIKRTSIGICMMFFQQWSGINALLYYGPLLMRRIGLGSDSATLIGAGGIGIVQFLAVVPAILFIDKVGRKPLLEYGGVVMGASYLAVSLLIWGFGDNWEENHLAAWLSVMCLYIFTGAYGLSYGPVAWILPNEVLPLSVRSKGAAAATASNWINNFFIGLVTPAFVSTSPSGTFLLFATACLCGTVWSRACVPETANVPLEEIDRLFGGEGVGRDEERKRRIMKDVGLLVVIEGLLGE